MRPVSRSTGTVSLLRGPSGCGKSDLALRLIDRGARLVADDRVVLTVEDGAVVAAAPPPLAGLLEVRGLGPLPVRPWPPPRSPWSATWCPPRRWSDCPRRRRRRTTRPPRH